MLFSKSYQKSSLLPHPNVLLLLRETCVYQIEELFIITIIIFIFNIM